ncbi:MAG: helix-turn-helix domain-containing protein [Nostoc sp. ChiSLP01]
MVYYTIRELSEALGIKTSSINRWIASKSLKAYFYKGIYWIDLEDLKNFIVHPPSSKARGILALIERDKLKALMGEVPINAQNHRRHRTPPRQIRRTQPRSIFAPTFFSYSLYPKIRTD